MSHMGRCMTRASTPPSNSSNPQNTQVHTASRLWIDSAHIEQRPTRDWAERRRRLSTQSSQDWCTLHSSHSIHAEGEASVSGALQCAGMFVTFSATPVRQSSSCTEAQQKHEKKKNNSNWIYLKYAEVCEGTSTLHLMDELVFPAATSEDIVYSVMSCI